MPLFEMPLEALKTYTGRNPRPDDFDTYWDDALKEMRGIDPQVAIEPAATASESVEYFDLWFTGVGGARIHAKYLRPKNVPEPHPAVVCFHGYSGSSGDWFEYRGWAAEGFSVAAIDVRGQGGLSEDVGGVTGNTHYGHIIRGLQDSPDKPDIDPQVDSFAMTVEYASGDIGVLSMTWGLPKGVTGQTLEDCLGPLGLLKIENAKVERLGPGGEKEAFAGLSTDMHPGQLNAFAAAIREGRPVAASGEDGLWALQTSLAALRSIQTGEAAPVLGPWDD